jgi:hypothetical protein
MTVSPACTDTGGVERLLIRLVRVRRSAALGDSTQGRPVASSSAISLEAAPPHADEEGSKQGGTCLASTRAARTSPPQGGRHASTAAAIGEKIGGRSSWRRRQPTASLLIGLSVDEDYRQVTYIAREAEEWSARVSGNFVNLVAAEPSPPPALKEEENDWEFSDDGGIGESSNNNAFNRR